MRQVQRGRKSFFWLLSTLMTLALTGFLVMPAQAANPVPNTNRGTIEICKSSRFGMAGRPFQFTISTSSGTGAPFTVIGGGCSGPISTPAGLNTVVEAPTNGLQVFAIRSRHVISKNLAKGTIVVRVKALSTPADERLVTYVNQPIPADGLKVCKSADADSPSLVGQPFTFTENGGPAYSVSAGTVAAPNCGPVTPYQLGTNVDVAELATPGTHVSDITVSDNRGSNFDTAAGTVTATIGSGVTIVTYTNAVTIGRPDGFIEVCKSAGDGYVRGSFDFTITDAGGVVGIESVAVGQCSPPVKVRSGNVTVTEAARSPYYVSAIFVVPNGRLVSSNLSNRTVTVTVPKGDEGTETTVTFENSTRTGQIKVCKTLTGRSEGLAGYKFYFDVTDVNGTHSLSVVAGLAGSTACVLDPVALPLHSAVSITERPVANVQVVSVKVAPISQDTGSAPPTANFTIGSGVTTATFTNRALGTLEVCKKSADASTATQTFRFSVNGAAAISVHADACSLPIVVPAGTATVLELGTNNFHLVGVTAVGPSNENRLISGPTENPAKVGVPFGGVGNETVVTFTDAVDTGRFKICKASTEPSLQNTSFVFSYSYTIGNTPFTGTVTVKPGGCSAFSGDIPVVDPNGQPIPVYVSEAAMAGVAVSGIVVDNGNLIASNPGAGTATISVYKGATTVTFTNVVKLPGATQSRFRSHIVVQV